MTPPTLWGKDLEEMIKLILGDCLEEMKKLPDKSIDLVLTDPPYNVKKDYGIYKDNLKPKHYREYIKRFIQRSREISNNKIVIILGSQTLREWWNEIPEAKLIIVKMGATSNNKVKGLTLQFHPVLTTVKAIIPTGISQSDLWEDIRWPGEGYYFNERRYGHPAMTPLKLTKRLVEFFSPENGLILDPFMGSGTTAVACKGKGRNFIGIEISPEYFKIAEERIKNTTPPLPFGDKK